MDIFTSALRAVAVRFLPNAGSIPPFQKGTVGMGAVVTFHVSPDWVSNMPDSMSSLRFTN
jgi:hypothetical protein